MEEGTILISVGESEKRRRKRRRRKKGSKEDHRVLTQRKKRKEFRRRNLPSHELSSVQAASFTVSRLFKCERERDCLDHKSPGAFEMRRYVWRGPDKTSFLIFECCAFRLCLEKCLESIVLRKKELILGQWCVSIMLFCPRKLYFRHFGQKKTTEFLSGMISEKRREDLFEYTRFFFSFYLKVPKLIPLDLFLLSSFSVTPHLVAF